MGLKEFFITLQLMLMVEGNQKGDPGERVFTMDIKDPIRKREDYELSYYEEDGIIQLGTKWDGRGNVPKPLISVCLSDSEDQDFGDKDDEDWNDPFIFKYFHNSNFEFEDGNSHETSVDEALKFLFTLLTDRRIGFGAVFTKYNEQVKEELNERDDTEEG